MFVTSNSEDSEVTEFPEATFCYFKQSTETHLLSPFLAMVLDLTTDTHLAVAQLPAITAELLQTDNDENWVLANDGAVNKLLSMGLIQTVSV